jgi:succinyl-diaminopimelate desuccinylase
MLSSVALTQELVRFNTINPPGAERACTEHLAVLLEAAGFAVELVPFGEGRAQLLARIGGAADRLPLAFTGHIDVVPLGAQPWSVDPFAADNHRRQALRPRLLGHEERSCRLRYGLHRARR